MKGGWSGVGFLFLLPSLAAADVWKEFAEKHSITSKAISEASGLAVSPSSDRFLWTINDSGGTPDLHLLNTDGSDRGKLRITDAKNTDWEDIASFTMNGQAYLLIADTGDNQAARKFVSITIVREPKLPTDGVMLDEAISPAWQIDFTYAGGPRDCEAVAVDTAQNKIILISKRTKPPEVYELSLSAPKIKGVLVLDKVGETKVESPTHLSLHNQPTGLDISADNSLAAVVTYYGVFLFPRKPEETWSQAFAHEPIPSIPHGLAQAESVAISKDGKNLYVVSEGKNSPIKIYQR